MSRELNLRFPDKDHVIVSFDGEESGALPFTNPLTVKDRRDIQWYIEVYGAHSLGDPDDKEAERIADLLIVWGKALFDAAFRVRAAARLFNQFQDREDETRLLTISAEHPAILSLPWELLHDPAKGGVPLFLETPRISIRRRVAGATGGRPGFKIEAKERLHLLFVVSRPSGSGFLDPRADPQAVLDALDEHAPGCFTWEFLRPATLDALVERLEQKDEPRVDILHFDGHGVFDRDGGLPEAAEKHEGTRFPFDGSVVKEETAQLAAKSPPNTGYLLFEKPDGQCDFVSAQRLGENLHRHKVPLIILSACQTADLGDNEEPMGSVAARLTAAGIPAVLAMTHSVLVHTTRSLFGAFYKDIARGHGIGESLDNARRYLANHPEKYEVQRGPERVPLVLYDWFLPALYQSGTDLPLLKESVGKGQETGVAPPRTNVPARPEAGFFGRRHELWDIERWFADKTRRITITGFGGQGKTALAEETGRWLVRIGMFEAAVILRYNEIPGTDALGVAVGNIGSVLGESLIDAKAAEAALRKTPTLVILDNLEAVAPEPLYRLLDAAVGWSEAGGSRVLCTTRKPEFGHQHYRVEGTLVHRRIVLEGLGHRDAPADALEWFAELMKLPPAPTVATPKRGDVIDLFDRVKFHPLSIRVLTAQLKTRTARELRDRLGQLLSGGPGGSSAATTSEDTPAELVASLELSLDQLDAAARQVLPRLGVFQGGAFEYDLLVITGLGDPHQGRREEVEAALRALDSGDPRTILRLAGADLPEGAEIPAELKAQLQGDGLREQADELRRMLAEIPAPVAESNIWPALRRQLEGAALIEAETVPGLTVPYLRFHPTLAPMLWAQLTEGELSRLSDAHRQQYYALASYLYQADTQNPHEARAIARRELPNLLHAVHAALDAGDPDAVDFVSRVNMFLDIFGLRQESEALIAKAEASAGEVGSEAWFVAQSNRGEQLLASGRADEAAGIFRTVLEKLGNAPNYQRGVTLARLGRCFHDSGRLDLAAEHQRESLAVLAQLEQTDTVKRQRGVCLTDLADALMFQGSYSEARKAYEDGLAVDNELGDLRGQGVTIIQLGTLAMREGNLTEAADRYRTVLALFQQLREPAMEAVLWHQLGTVFQEARQWDEAERHYREAARIREQQGIISGSNGAAATWNQLASVSERTGKPEAAESWYWKALEVFRGGGDRVNLTKCLNNLAGLLRNQPSRLVEARELAEEALAIKQTLDPGAAEIWKTYDILAEIADQESRPSQARAYRRLARASKRSFAGTRNELKEHLPLIVGTIMATQKRKERKELEALLPDLEQHGWTSLVAAIRRLLAGERDADVLCEGLGLEDSMIIETILHALADPSTLNDILPDEGQE